jgi:hypothetical protein
MTNQTLAVTSSAERAKKFLVGIANLPDDTRRGLQWLQANYPYFMKEIPLRPVDMGTNFEEKENFSYMAAPEGAESKYRYLVLRLRDSLRELWRAPHRETKQWQIFRILQDFFLQGDKTKLHTPLASDSDYFLKGVHARGRSERYLFKFIDLADSAKYCAAHDCTKPYFFGRRNQRYCCPKCSGESQRQFKREWWRKNGQRWRESRTKERRTEHR